MIKSTLIGFLIVAVIFLVIDIIWLSFAVKTVYKPQIGHLLLEKPIYWAAILFYVLYCFGLTIIIIRPALTEGLVFQAFINGLIFGAVAYGTYNLTNMATVKNWSSIVVFIDITWGGLLSGFSAAATVYIMKIFISD